MPLDEALKQKYSLIRQLSFIIFVETLKADELEERGRKYLFFIYVTYLFIYLFIYLFFIYPRIQT